MKICLFSPYAPKHVGGGEKYFLDVARSLSEAGHDVYVGLAGEENQHHDFSLKDEVIRAAEIRQQYERFLDASLAGIHFVACPLRSNASFFTKLWWTKQFDVMYYLTDGSLFFSLAKKNILHIQFPFNDDRRGLMDKIKFFNWPIRNTNSYFTKCVIESHWHIPIQYVHHPMIPSVKNAEQFINQKQRVILHVGRFFRQLHSKRQDTLVKIFAELLKKEPQLTQGWKLVLVGSVEDEGYAQEVAELAKDLPVEIYHKTTRQELLQWYQKAAIYWHATGYGIDEQKEPAKTEHFGISTVEAMTYGCVPVVIGKGGQPEVVGEKLHHLLWQTSEECVSKTIEVMCDSKEREQLAEVAIDQAKEFSEEKFKNTLYQMITTE